MCALCTTGQGVECLDLTVGVCMFTFKTLLPWLCHCTSLHSVWVPVPPHPHPQSVFSILVVPTGALWYFTILNRTSLMSNDLEHIFTCSFPIYISSFPVFIQIFCLIFLFFFPLLWSFAISFYIRDTSPLLDLSLEDIFSWSLASFFIFLNSHLSNNRSHLFGWSPNYYFFFYMDCAFGFVSEKSLHDWTSWGLYIFF